ncbi:secreted frizzled-related protein 2-like [Scleropages formosus]|uniref:Secreted frizzled-related protein 2 n=1 Tax=Scleropages formosus TaxID=113540 RepID=A0A0P7UGZ5_SCLFO|nr:secreted frizzled-related protein 2-like [Scleropages formosus]
MWSTWRLMMPFKLVMLWILASATCVEAFHGMYPLGQQELLYKKSKCKAIPASMQLCSHMEYSAMRLPNLLGHETMDEVLQQAASWLPLVHKQCHPDTRKLLCSLFAPVCLDELDEPIEPCRSLCEGVKKGCAPLMSAFGFPWPDMLDCSRFPADTELCIPPASGPHLVPAAREGETTPFCVLTACAPFYCSLAPSSVRDLLVKCHTSSSMSDISMLRHTVCKTALKIRVKEISYMNGDTRIIPESKSRTIYKLKGLTERDLRKTALWLRDGLQCTCDEMNNINAAYLVMGQNLDGHLVITSVKRWQRGHREFKRISRSMRKLQC